MRMMRVTRKVKKKVKKRKEIIITPGSTPKTQSTEPLELKLQRLPQLLSSRLRQKVKPAPTEKPRHCLLRLQLHRVC